MNYNLEPNIITEIIKDVPTLTNLSVLGIIKDSESAYKLIGENYVKNRFVHKLYKVHSSYDMCGTHFLSHNDETHIFYAESLEELYMQIISYKKFNGGVEKYFAVHNIVRLLKTNYRSELESESINHINKKWRRIWKNYFNNIELYYITSYVGKFWNIHKTNKEFIDIQLKYIEFCHKNNIHIYINECNINGLF